MGMTLLKVLIMSVYNSSGINAFLLQMGVNFHKTKLQPSTKPQKSSNLC
jgi:hypothetical protein